MNPLTYIKNMTSDDVQRLVRTAMQFLSGALVSHGVITANASWVEPAIGATVFIATIGWQLYGNRFNAKLAEIAKLDVKVVAPPAAAAAVDHPNVLSSDAVKIVLQ